MWLAVLGDCVAAWGRMGISQFPVLWGDAYVAQRPAWCFACEKMRTKLAKLSDGPQNVGTVLGMLRDWDNHTNRAACAF